MLHYLLCILQLILSPAKGWEDISADGRDPRRLLLRGFLPFVIIVACSCFVRLLYHYPGTLTMLTITAIVTFVQYLVSYLIAMFVMPWWLPDMIEGEINDVRFDTYINYSVALMALVTLLKNLLPIDVSVLYFMPVYVALIMWKGERYMAVKPGRSFRFMVLAILAVILPPILLEALFGMILI